jgi:recombination protein RecA
MTKKKEVIQDDTNLPEKEDKRKKLKDLLSKIKKDHGSESIMILGDKPKIKLECIPSGSLSLDLALGVGGYPLGRVIEIYGPESSGKSTLALTAVANAQKLGYSAAYIDMEHAIDPTYAQKLGVVMDELIFSQPDYGEQALTIAETIIDSGECNIVVIDSVAALVPKKELEGEVGDSNMGLQARMMSQALRKITSKANRNNCTVIFINQLREKIGVMFGNPETTTGGNALKFYASIRLDIRRKTQIKDGTNVIGNETTVKVIKNKVAPPFKIAEFEILYGEGISKYGEIIKLATEHNIINKAGAWFSYNNEKVGQGADSVKKKLIEDSAFYNEVLSKIMEIYSPQELDDNEKKTIIAEEKSLDKDNVIEYSNE